MEFKRIWSTFSTFGNYQYSEDVSIGKNGKATIETLLQENYDKKDRRTVTMSKESAIAAARAILKHYGEGLE